MKGRGLYVGLRRFAPQPRPTVDVSFNEEQNRLRSGYAAENISLINKISLNLLKNERSVKVGIKNKRLKAGWDNDYMMKVLTVGFKSV